VPTGIRQREPPGKKRHETALWSKEVRGGREKKRVSQKEHRDEKSGKEGSTSIRESLESEALAIGRFAPVNLKGKRKNDKRHSARLLAREKISGRKWYALRGR